MSSPVIVIGAGPAGLAAAEVLSAAGRRVDLYDAMPSVGRKFLLAGRGGLNLTHGEDYERFLTRYRPLPPLLQAALDAFRPADLRDWCEDLGIATFVGSSNRVFPVDLKAAPLLRAWLRRLHAQGVNLHSRHRWLGWNADGSLRFALPAGESSVAAAPTLLALGGASWARLGSDGAWTAPLRELGVEVHPLRPSNCGFDVIGGWSPYLSERHAGQPIKPVALSFEGRRQAGEFVLTATGVEGSLVYAFSAALRDAIEREGAATLSLDLLPQHAADKLAGLLASQGRRSLGSFLKSQLQLSSQKIALLHELRGELPLAQALKALPLTLAAARPIDEAISSAGGLAFEALDAHWQLRARPGLFAAGEMLDWEAPTGGYLLNACIASGRAAARGLLAALP